VHKVFQALAHVREEPVTSAHEDQVEAAFRDLERLLLSRLLKVPYHDPSRQVRELALTDAPSAEDLMDARAFVREELRPAFFAVASPAWLPMLDGDGWFEKLAPPDYTDDGWVSFPTWPQATYLVRVAPERPDETLNIRRTRSARRESARCTCGTCRCFSGSTTRGQSATCPASSATTSLAMPPGRPTFAWAPSRRRSHDSWRRAERAIAALATADARTTSADAHRRVLGRGISEERERLAEHMFIAACRKWPELTATVERFLAIAPEADRVAGANNIGTALHEDSGVAVEFRKETSRG
jgi:hypothetical protein